MGGGGRRGWAKINTNLVSIDKNNGSTDVDVDGDDEIYTKLSASIFISVNLFHSDSNTKILFILRSNILKTTLTGFHLISKLT